MPARTIRQVQVPSCALPWREHLRHRPVEMPGYVTLSRFLHGELHVVGLSMPQADDIHGSRTPSVWQVAEFQPRKFQSVHGVDQQFEGKAFFARFIAAVQAIGCVSNQFFDDRVVDA